MSVTDTFSATDEALVAGAARTSRPVEVGDIFEASWGYDQTNIDYYLVQSVTLSGKSVRVAMVGQTITRAGGPGGDRVIPDPSRLLDEPSTHRLQTGWRGQPTIKVRSWGVWASRWEGESRYQTDPQFGH